MSGRTTAFCHHAPAAIPRQVAWLLLKHLETGRLHPEEQYRRSPELALCGSLAREFCRAHFDLPQFRVVLSEFDEPALRLWF